MHGGNVTTGKRVQIYIPADLIEKWDQLPRYERSAEVAKALRELWKRSELTPEVTPAPEMKSSVKRAKSLPDAK